MPTKFLLTLLLILVYHGASYAQTSADFSAGSVIVGADSTACSGAIEGSIRYSSANSCIELCDGVDWSCQGGGAGAPTSGLVGHWTLDESSGTTAADSSGSGNNGTLEGTPTWQPTGGQVDGSLNFPGSSRVRIGDPANLRTAALTQEMSISLWVKLDSLDLRDIMGKQGQSSARSYKIASRNSGEIQFTIAEDISSGYGLFSTTALSVGTWAHVVVIFKANDFMRIYIDGVLDAEDTSASVPSTNFLNNGLPHYIAGRGDADTFYPNLENFLGSLDDVRLYDRALTAQEVLDTYNAGSSGGGGGSSLPPNCTNDTPVECILDATRSNDDAQFTAANIANGVNILGVTGTLAGGSVPPDCANDSTVECVLEATRLNDDPQFTAANIANGVNILGVTGTLTGGGGVSGPTAGLVSHWELDESSGTTAADSAGTNDGTLINSPTWQPTGGEIDGAIELGGTSVIRVADDSVLEPSNDMTVAAWVRFDSVGRAQTIVIKRHTASPWYSYELLMNASSQLMFQYRVSGGSGGSRGTSAGYSSGSWHHVVGIRRGNDIELYIDGATPATWTAGLPLNGNPILPSSDVLEIGSPNAPTNVDGRVDDVRIYDRALSPAEVSDLYNKVGGAPPDCVNDSTVECLLEATRLNDDPQFTAANIANGVNILGVTGTLTGGAGCSFILPEFSDLVGQIQSTTVSSAIKLVDTQTCSASIDISGDGSPQFRICNNSTCSSVDHTWGSASQSIDDGQYLQIRATTGGSAGVVRVATASLESTDLEWSTETIGDKYAFVTSTGHSGNLGGVSGADAICQARADAAGLGGTYLAWIADGTDASAPANRFNKNSSPYRLPSGTKVADNWADLTDGTLDAAINQTETGGVPGVVSVPWTNVQTDGTRKGSTTCIDWGSSSFVQNGEIGQRTATDSTWTDTAVNNCGGGLNPLYCFQQ